ncbi:50S ribosomal protein L19 [Roseibium sp. TrichSKD4]|nr:50S ribosomal protein L19 [Roseibium sp. TrichSKD4]
MAGLSEILELEAVFDWSDKPRYSPGDNVEVLKYEKNGLSGPVEEIWIPAAVVSCSV